MDSILNKIQELLFETGIKELERKAFIQQIQAELKDKKYGLVWENKVEKVSEELKTHLPYLTEIEEKRLLDDMENEIHHVLIEGDNLEALTLLQTTHKRGVDVCYIDPPYNTENKDFVYNDNIVDKEDVYRHSKWLSFMEKRLRLVYDLLADDGIIFISIDNNEFAQLKLLCDEIFGEDSFVTIIHVEMSTTQGMKVKSAKKGNIVKNAEYILVYSKDGHKNIAKKVLYDFRPEYDSHYSKILGASNEVLNLKDVFLNQYPSEEIKNIVNAYSSNAIFRKFVEENVSKIFRYDKVTGFNASEFEEDVVTFIEKGGRQYVLQRKGNKVKQLMFLSDSFGECNDFKNSNGLRKIRGDWWSGFYLDMGNISKEGNIEFKNGKKPKRLIKQLLEMTTDKDSTILDFFAGSGTTGHAVLELNKEDGGNRKFILCTNNEVSREKQMEFFNISGKNKAEKIEKFEKFKKDEQVTYEEGIKTSEFQSLGICQAITYKRLENVIKGNTSSRSSVPSLPANLHYYKINTIPKVNNSTDNATEYLTKGIEIIAINENTFNKKNFKDYSILYSKDKAILVYLKPFVLGYEVIEISKELEGYPQSQKIIYSTMTDVSIQGMKVKEYPEEILEQINRIQEILKQWEVEASE